jgi:zinc protease
MVDLLGLWRRASLVVAGAALLLFVACAAAPAGPASRTPAAEAPPAGSASSGAAATPLPPPFLDPAVLRGTLPNGLRYCVLRRDEPAGRAAVWLAVNAGSVLEDDDQRGLAHFVEHMAFGGTTHYPGHAILDFLQRAGMTIGPDVNANTGLDETVYQLTLPSDQAGLVVQGLDVLRDIAENVSFEPAAVDQERAVILEEWRQRRGAGARARDEQNPVVFAGSRYAERDPIGLTETIRTAPVAAIKRFYTDWYRPELMGVVAVGDFDAKAVESAIVERFGSLQNPPAARPRPVFPVPHAGPPKVTIHSDPEFSMSSVTLLDRVDHTRRETRDDFRSSLVEYVYFAIVAERLSELRDSPRSVLVKTAAGRTKLSRTLDGFYYSVTPREGMLDNALYLLASELVRLAHFGVLPAELERAKKDVKARMQTSLEESSHAPLGRKAGELVRHLFEREEVPGETSELEWLDELMPSITLEEVNAFARERASPSGRIVAIDVPSGRPPPVESGVTATLALAQHSELGPWRVSAPKGPLLASEPVPGTIVARHHDAGADADVWILSNGARVVAKHTELTHNGVLVRGFQPGGTSLASDAEYLDARFASAIVASNGAGPFNQRDLNTFLAGSSVSASIGFGEVEQTIEAKARTDELPLLFQYLYLRLTSPHSEQYAFDIWKEHTLEALRHRDDVPEQRFAAEATRALTRDHLRRRSTDASMLEHLDRERALAIWQRQFANFDGFTFVVVGRFDPQKLETYATTYLASLPTTRQTPRFKDPHITYATGVVERTLAGEVENKARFWLEFQNAFAFEPHAESDARILAQVLQLRLQDLLRFELGSIYTVGVRADVTRVPDSRRSLALQFTCAPENLARLRRAVFDELAVIVKQGISDDYLTKVREELRRRDEAERKTDGWWLTRIADAYRYGDDFAQANDLAAVVARVTSDDVKKTLGRLFDPRRYVLVTMQPGANSQVPTGRAVDGSTPVDPPKL